MYVGTNNIKKSVPLKIGTFNKILHFVNILVDVLHKGKFLGDFLENLKNIFLGLLMHDVGTDVKVVERSLSY